MVQISTLKVKKGPGAQRLAFIVVAPLPKQRWLPESSCVSVLIILQKIMKMVSSLKEHLDLFDSKYGFHF